MMSHVSVEHEVRIQSETPHAVMLRLWDDVEQMLAVQAPEPPVPARLSAGAPATQRQQSQSETPSRVRYAYD
jgi:hypothetical protein